MKEHPAKSNAVSDELIYILVYSFLFAIIIEVFTSFKMQTFIMITVP